MESKEQLRKNEVPFKASDIVLGKHNAYVGQLVAIPHAHPNPKIKFPEDVLPTGIITKIHIEEGYGTFRAEVLTDGQIINCFNYQLRTLEEECQK